MTILNAIRTFVQNEIGKMYSAFDARLYSLHKQIDKKLDKSDYAKADWEELDPSQNGYIENKPFGYRTKRGIKHTYLENADDYYFSEDSLIIDCHSPSPQSENYPFMADGEQYEFNLELAIMDIDGNERSFEFTGTGIFTDRSAHIGIFDITECSPFNPLKGCKICGLDSLKQAVQDPINYYPKAVFELQESFLDEYQFDSLNDFGVVLFGKFLKYDSLPINASDMPDTWPYLAIQNWLSQNSDAQSITHGHKSAAFGESRSTGIYSISGGYGSEARADNSMAIGYHTETYEDSQAVVGRVNINSSSCAFVVGNGEVIKNGNSTTYRYSNAFAVGWNGDGYFDGKVYKNTSIKNPLISNSYTPNTDDELLSRKEVYDMIREYVAPLKRILNNQLYVRDLQYGSTKDIPRITDITYSDDLICVYVDDKEFSDVLKSYGYLIFRLIIPARKGEATVQIWPRIYTTAQNNGVFYGTFGTKTVKLMSDDGHTPST